MRTFEQEVRMIVLNKAEEFYLQPLYHRSHGRRESKKAFLTRVEWKDKGFPPIIQFVKDTDYSISTLQKYSVDYGWEKTKDNYILLLAEVKAEKRQAEIDAMEDEYSEIWKKLRDSIKSCIFDLNERILDSADDKEIKQVFNEYAVLIKNLDTVQKAERLNFRLPNSYKETEKLELKQSGELNIGLSDETVNLFEKIKEMRKEEQEQ